MKINKLRNIDYEYWNFIFKITMIVLVVISLIIAAIALSKSNDVKINLNELKSTLIESEVLIADNATIKYIDGLKCLIFDSGGEICSGG